jgi:hypothetical protein
MTGFIATDVATLGKRAFCAVMTSAFLDVCKSRGNDLSTPMPEFGLSGSETR